MIGQVQYAVRLITKHYVVFIWRTTGLGGGVTVMRYEGFGNLSKGFAPTEGRRSFCRRRGWERGRCVATRARKPMKKDQVV